MPCNSDHMRQTGTEATFQSTAQLYVWLHDRLVSMGWLTVPTISSIVSLTTNEPIRKQAENYYAEDVGQVEALCALVRYLRSSDPINVSPGNEQEAFDQFCALNFKDPMCRKLMNWVEEHERIDANREAQLNYDRRREKEQVVMSVFKHMSDDQFNLLYEMALLTQKRVQEAAESELLTPE